MADFSKPDNLSDYANVWDYVKDVQESLALWQDGTTDTNITTGSKRYSSTNKRFETFNGTAWVPLIALDTDQANAYQIRVAKANSVDLADLATNALRLGSVLASEYVQTTDARMNNSRAWDATIDAALIATARNVLSIYSQLQINNALALKANTASPDLTGTPTVPTAAVGTNTTQIASTAFMQGQKTYLKPLIPLSTYILTGWTDVDSYAVPVYQAGVRVAVDFYINVTGAAGGTSGVSFIFSLNDTSPYDLRNLGANMAGQHRVLFGGVDSAGNVVNVRLSEEVPPRFAIDNRSSAYSYTIRFSCRVYARDLI